jgi:Bacterial regulatory proteins, luxR family
MTQKMIAFEFGISINTVGNLAANAYKKLDVHGAAAAVHAHRDVHFYCGTRVDFGPIREQLKKPLLYQLSYVGEGSFARAYRCCARRLVRSRPGLCGVTRAAWLQHGCRVRGCSGVVCHPSTSL